MREINEAYDFLMKNQQFSNDNKYNNHNNYRGGYSQSDFMRVREYINRNDIRNAEDELNRITNRNAEWFFLRGLISIKKGWYSQGYQDIQMAVNMDPNNYEYRETLNRLMNANRNYTNYSYQRRGGSNNDMCSTLTCLCCTDQCCECLGGDLISCC